MVIEGDRSYHKIKLSDNPRSVAMRGIPTVRMPVLTLFTNSTRDKTVMTRNDRPLLSAKVLDSITCLFISELVRLRSALHMVRIRISLL